VKPIVAVPKRVADPLRAVSANSELGLVGNWRPRAPEPSFLRRDQCLNPRHAESARRDPSYFNAEIWPRELSRSARRHKSSRKHDEPRFGTTSAALPGASTYAGPRPLTKDSGDRSQAPSSCHSPVPNPIPSSLLPTSPLPNPLELKASIGRREKESSGEIEAVKDR